MASTSERGSTRNRPVGSRVDPDTRPAQPAVPNRSGATAATGRPAAAAAPAASEDHEVHEDHGHSVAAWTAVGVVMLGSLVMSVAVVLASLWLFVVGAVIAVVGAVLGRLLSAMGYGSKGRSTL